jgi:predicted dehydrogenase
MKNLISRKKFLKSTAGLAVLTSLGVHAKNTAEKKIKIAVIGCGSVSNMYLPHLSKSKYVELVSTCDIIETRAKAQAEKYKIPNYYNHIDKLLAGAPFDMLVNLTNMQEHGRLNKIALNANKNIWSEKPLANSYAEGKEVLTLAKNKGLKIWGAPAVVMSPQFSFMAKAVKEGKLGKVAAATAHYGHTGPSWSAFFYEELGGSLPDLGVYNLASLTGILGPAKSIMAITSIVTPERTVDDKGKIKVIAEDNAMVIMDHGNGVLSHVMCGFNYFDPYGHGGKGQHRSTITVLGSHGNMQLIGYDWAPSGVDLATDKDENGTRFVEDAGEYVWEMGASTVAESMATGKSCMITPEHALHVLEIIESARKSGKTGMKINLKSTFNFPLV